MLQHSGLNRRAFLRTAGSTAVAGVAGFGSVAGVAGAAREMPNGTFDFDTPYNRIGSDSSKWDEQARVFGVGQLVAGMGTADLDFKAAPCITKALLDRIQHENHGYTTIPASHAQSMISWNKRHYGCDIDPTWLVNSAAVHPAIISALRAFSPPGSKVIVQTPSYSGFFSDITKVGCKAEESPLKLVNGRYSMDFEDLERRIDHDTNTLILCNPQNPTGNVWSREDLLTLGEICTKRRVVVLADEIHCDFVRKGMRYTPYASLGNEQVVRNSITFKSASKSFNLAAMKSAYMFSSNADYLQRVKVIHRDEINALGMIAHRAAYTDGDSWLEQLLPYIDGNMAYTEDFIKSQMPLVTFVKPQATYLAWLDVSRVIERIGAKQKAIDATRSQDPSLAPVTPSKIVERYLVEHAKVHILAGSGFGMAGASYMRMNIGTSRKTLQNALTSLASALSNA